VIVWLNGTFGSGKTSTALRLHERIPGSRVFDPETVGYMLAPNLADRAVSDFQHWPPWRPLVAATASELARYTGEHLIAPQTVLVRDYLEEIFTGLRAAGLAVFHVLLDADENVLRRRIEGSQEARSWRLAHLAGYGVARPWLIKAADLVVDTAELAPDAVADRIASALPGLTPGP
jgi:chloramphenicol 3-O-phosphotransferase